MIHTHTHTHTNIHTHTQLDLELPFSILSCTAAALGIFLPSDVIDIFLAEAHAALLLQTLFHILHQHPPLVSKEVIKTIVRYVFERERRGETWVGREEERHRDIN